jgi:hypothetical protein
VNQAYYVEILKRLCEIVHRNKPELWPIVWILHHDNAAAHKALSVRQFRVQKYRLLKWNASPVPLMWLRMTSGCFLK